MLAEKEAARGRLFLCFFLFGETKKKKNHGQAQSIHL